MGTLFWYSKKFVNVLFHVGFHGAGIFNQENNTFPKSRFRKEVKNSPDTMDVNTSITSEAKYSISPAYYCEVRAWRSRAEENYTVIREER